MRKRPRKDIGIHNIYKKKSEKSRKIMISLEEVAGSNIRGGTDLTIGAGGSMHKTATGSIITGTDLSLTTST